MTFWANIDRFTGLLSLMPFGDSGSLLDERFVSNEFRPQTRKPPDLVARPLCREISGELSREHGKAPRRVGAARWGVGAYGRICRRS